MISYSDDFNGYAPVSQKYNGLNHVWSRTLWQAGYAQPKMFHCPSATTYYRALDLLQEKFNNDGNNWTLGCQYGMNRYFGTNGKGGNTYYYLPADADKILNEFKLFPLRVTRRASETILLADSANISFVDGHATSAYNAIYTYQITDKIDRYFLPTFNE